MWRAAGEHRFATGLSSCIQRSAFCAPRQGVARQLRSRHGQIPAGRNIWQNDRRRIRPYRRRPALHRYRGDHRVPAWQKAKGRMVGRPSVDRERQHLLRGNGQGHCGIRPKRIFRPEREAVRAAGPVANFCDGLARRRKSRGEDRGRAGGRPKGAGCDGAEIGRATCSRGKDRRGRTKTRGRAASARSAARAARTDESGLRADGRGHVGGAALDHRSKMRGCSHHGREHALRRRRWRRHGDRCFERQDSVGDQGRRGGARARRRGRKTVRKHNDRRDPLFWAEGRSGQRHCCGQGTPAANQGGS
ncbi:MAG: hypothetical protein BWZ10_02882 [candidate division BRC1 bacterium ADurb.BinA364]|nr:MAG: hypothetical protein BWZ10_02882 [candidate division BRC1 bacterium ADurb.BinA364]